MVIVSTLFFIFLLTFLLFICSLIFLVYPVQAQIIINEVYPNPFSDETEWIELFNSSTQSVGISGYSLEDKLSSPKTIYSFEELILDPNQYLLASVSGQLNNSGDGVVLKNNLGIVIDEMDYQSSTQGLSWLLESNTDQFILDNPSPLAINQIVVASPSPIPSPSPVVSPSPSLSTMTEDLASKLELTSVMTCPDSSAEWFELKNISTSSLVDSLYLTDAQGNVFNFGIDILAGQKQRYYLERHILNNSGDTFTLVQNPDNILFSYDLPSCKEKGIEFNFENGLLVETTTSEEDVDDQENLTGEVLGVSDQNKETLIDKEIKQQALFKVPSSYLEKINLLTSSQISEDFENDINRKNGTLEDQSNLNKRFLFSITLIIFGGIILSFLGIMYFYARDWFKDKIVA